MAFSPKLLQQGAAGGLAKNYIEDVFSTYLYTGNGGTQTITNGIDLSGKGGLVWTKNRPNAYDHFLYDTARGATKYLISNSTIDQQTVSTSLTSFNSNGFTLGANDYGNITPGAAAVSWTFRKQPKFFDIVTWTGNGTTQSISHNLGSVPGFIIIKRTNSSEDWWCFHRYNFTQRLKLNAGNEPVNTVSVKYLGDNVNDVTPTSTSFTVGDTGGLNGSGGSFIAYLFAHNAGGFGLTGTENVISCGLATTTARVALGFEPQWILSKPIGSTAPWEIADNMRGMKTDFTGQLGLYPNLAAAESTDNYFKIDATGFTPDISNFIYIAIRRGPMKVPTVGTSVFTPITYNGNGTSQTITGSFGVPDLGLGIGRSGGMAGQNTWYDRLRGKQLALIASSTNAEYDAAPGGEGTMTTTMNGMIVENLYGRLNDGTTPYILYFMSRAPSFFDEVCYTGTGSARTITHNLGVVPEMMIVKSRSAAQQWSVYTSGVGPTGRMPLQLGNAADYATVYWNDTAPTSSVFTVGSNATVNQNTATYVAYLFATCAGVSKVGSYTGTATTKQIDCGFTGGARFVLIKRTDSTGDWYVWDSARGIIAGNDPYLLLNSTAAEVTNTDYIDSYSPGFELSSTAPTALNASGGNYIFLAIA